MRNPFTLSRLARLLPFVMLVLASTALAEQPSVDRVRAIEAEARPVWDTVDKYVHFRDKLLVIVNAPLSPGEAMDALIVLARFARYDGHDKEAIAHLKQLSHDYRDHPELVPRLGHISHLGPEIAGPALAYLHENSTLLELRENALLELAGTHHTREPGGEAEALFEKASSSPIASVREEALRNLYAIRSLRIGQKAPEVEGVGLDGQQLRVSELLGKVVVLDFWGTWCGPCVKGLPEVASLQDKYPDDLQVIGVNTDTDRAKLDDFLLKNPSYAWPQLIDGSTLGPICQTWNVSGFPTYIVLDRDGVIRAKGSLPAGLVEELCSNKKAPGEQ